MGLIFADDKFVCLVVALLRALHWHGVTCMHHDDAIVFNTSIHSML